MLLQSPGSLRRAVGPVVVGILAATAAAAARAETTAAAASDSSTAPADALQEVVVTAQFRQQRLQDAPIAITAVNAAMLQARGDTNMPVS